MIAVIIPTYGRADRLARVAANIAENTETAHRVVFAVEVDDTASIDVAAELDVDVVVNERKANYSGAITTAYLATPAEHVFAGADDLNFHPGWDIPALALMDDWTMVVGTNDLLNPYVTAGLHASGNQIAVANIRERLQLLYGSRAQLAVAENPGGGTRVTITVPYVAQARDGATMAA